MTLDEFKDKTDLYSADLSRWPQDMIKPAVAFMKDNAEAAAYFDAALKLDAELRAYEPHPADTAVLEARILQAIAGEMPAATPAAAVIAAAKPARFSRAWLFAPTGGLFAAAIVGFFMGFNPPAVTQGAAAPLDPAYMVEEQQLASASDDDEGEIF